MLKIWSLEKNIVPLQRNRDRNVLLQNKFKQEIINYLLKF